MAYSVSLVRESRPIRDTLGETSIVVPATDALAVTTTDGHPVAAVVTYWMVWKGLYPDTKYFRPR
jgi:hypothetical protein